MQPLTPSVASEVAALLRAARAACPEPLAPSGFDEREFQRALAGGDLRLALDLADSIADENRVPEAFWSTMLAAARRLESAGYGDLQGNVQYYENGLECERSAAGRTE